MLRSEFKNAKIGVHCHNDYGQAMANVYTSIECGADFIDVCINGIGERAGNASLAETAAAAECFYGLDTGIKLDKMCGLSSFLGDITRLKPHKNMPLVGEWAFAHGDEQHYANNEKSQWVFEGTKAETFGNRQKILLGKQSGKAAAAAKLRSLGIKNPDETLTDYVNRIVHEETALRKTVLDDDDILRMVDDFLRCSGNRKGTSDCGLGGNPRG
jgi:isopropylmalate/homocitrate/citramalate synthase